MTTMTQAPPSRANRYERLLIRADEFPLGALFRVAVGYCLFPAFSVVTGGQAPRAGLLLWFLAVLLALRVLPALVRRVVSFPAEAQAVWAQRRKLAKRFDSYQWRKLLWLGFGMVGYGLTAQGMTAWELVLTLFCLAGGAAGEWVWRTTAAQHT